MFGGLFFAYSLYRWLYPDAFHIGSQHLNISLGTGNTFVLLFSSLTMAMAVHYATENNPRMTVMFLGFTWLLGAAFIGIKAVEWTTDYREGLVPGLNWTYFNHEEGLRELANKPIGPQNVMMYFVIYFSMTGLHAIHMVVGLLLVAAFMRYAARGQFNNGNDQPVEILGLYWHFVDIVWVFLFPLLYLIAGFFPPWWGGGGP
jgi:cytochrome c oxidase subunit 3